MLNRNPNGDYPNVDETSYVDPTAVIIGNISIEKNVFVGPGAVIRADELGSSVDIKDNCNVQDRVIVHALESSSVTVRENTSLSHGCIVHGPCIISKNCFIGFGSVVFKANIGDRVCVKHLAVVEGVDIPAGRIIESGRAIMDNNDALDLKYTSEEIKDFMAQVLKANLDLARLYKKNKKAGGCLKNHDA
ncbi:MAG: carbonate dehydratase [Candidatus Omnitrophica bacterium]|nr:carbonate dehydratase [Candidatus Omnitrophota bacterium]